MKQEVVTHASKKGGKQIALALTAQVCPICKESHPIYNCAEFLKKTVQDWKAEIKKKQLCINCLKTENYAKECKSSNCRKCAKVHNTLLHIDLADTRVESSTSGDTQSLKEERQSTSTRCNIVSCQSSAYEFKVTFLWQIVAS